jgi:ubiquinone/menaquinone biosynthesis C-methylase UbiE
LLYLGCGDGWASLYFARSGADVFCCDISPKSIILAKKYAAENGLESKITAAVMPAENLCFGDNFFDFVFMNAALYHCDIEKVSKEMFRM